MVEVKAPITLNLLNIRRMESLSKASSMINNIIFIVTVLLLLLSSILPLSSLEYHKRTFQELTIKMFGVVPEYWGTVQLTDGMFVCK